MIKDNTLADRLDKIHATWYYEVFKEIDESHPLFSRAENIDYELSALYEALKESR